MKKDAQEITISALFHDHQAGHEAIDALEETGVMAHNISFILDQRTYQQQELKKVMGSDYLHPEAVHAGKVGGLIGAVVGGLTAITTVLTGGTSLLAVGPFIALLGLSGGILGALMGSGFTEEEAREVDAKLQEGAALVMVHTSDAKIADMAYAVLQGRNPERLKQRQD